MAALLKSWLDIPRSTTATGLVKFFVGSKTTNRTKALFRDSLIQIITPRQSKPACFHCHRNDCKNPLQDPPSKGRPKKNSSSVPSSVRPSMKPIPPNNPTSSNSLGLQPLPNPSSGIRTRKKKRSSPGSIAPSTSGSDILPDHSDEEVPYPKRPKRGAARTSNGKKARISLPSDSSSDSDVSSLNEDHDEDDEEVTTYNSVTTCDICKGVFYSAPTVSSAQQKLLQRCGCHRPDLHIEWGSDKSTIGSGFFSLWQDRVEKLEPFIKAWYDVIFPKLVLPTLTASQPTEKSVVNLKQSTNSSAVCAF